MNVCRFTWKFRFVANNAVFVTFIICFSLFLSFSCRIQTWRTCRLKCWDSCIKRFPPWQQTLRRGSKSTPVRRTSQNCILPLRDQVKKCIFLSFFFYKGNGLHFKLKFCFSLFAQQKELPMQVGCSGCVWSLGRIFLLHLLEAISSQRSFILMLDTRVRSVSMYWRGTGRQSLAWDMSC